MKFLLQKNIWKEKAYDRFIDSLINQDIEFEEVNVVPFTDFFDKEIDFIPNYIFGSGRFVNICRQKGFPTFKSFKPIELFYAKIFWVNGGGIDITWGEFKKIPIAYPTFIKPYTEKFFTGTVIEKIEDLDKIQLSTSFIENEDKEIIIMSPAVNIKDEIRFFVLGGEIITASYYKINGINKQARIDQLHEAWRVLDYILSLDNYIDNGFVIDLGLIDGDWKIVELNNLNSAGLYECDTDAIVRGLKYL